MDHGEWKRLQLHNKLLFFLDIYKTLKSSDSLWCFACGAVNFKTFSAPPNHNFDISLKCLHNLKQSWTLTCKGPCDVQAQWLYSMGSRSRTQLCCAPQPGWGGWGWWWGGGCRRQWCQQQLSQRQWCWQQWCRWQWYQQQWWQWCRGQCSWKSSNLCSLWSTLRPQRIETEACKGGGMTMTIDDDDGDDNDHRWWWWWWGWWWWWWF